jgi:pimeloyl-ACP methyl ester carboxylesterase
MRPSLRARRGIAFGATAAAGLLVLAGCGGSDGSSSSLAVPQALTCDESIRTSFKPDELTKVLLVKSFKKGDPLLSPNVFDPNPVALSDLCLVKLLVGPGNPGPVGAPSTSPGIGIEVWLPAKDRWNGRFHATGNGGWAGSEEADVTRNGSSAFGNDYRFAAVIAGSEGSVTASADDGHQSGQGVQTNMIGSFAMNPDGTINTTLWKDFSERSLHELAVKTKALATAYYGSAPKFSYWDGGSTGGRQGLKLAQTYPEDFDGIISGFPAINWARFSTAAIYPQVVMQRDLGGSNLTAAQLDLVSNAAISACDVEGGEHLGYVTDAASCTYDPTKDAKVICQANGGNNATAACVTPLQARAVNKMWYGQTADGSAPDPTLDNGLSSNLTGLQRWYGVTRGTSLLGLAGDQPSLIALHHVAVELQDAKLADASFKNATGNGADGWKQLTYAQLSNAFDRGIALQSSLANIDTDNPDLSAFKARGGKLLHYHGQSDQVIMPFGSVNYYNRVASQMGGFSEIQNFYRFYLIPGMGHGPVNGTSNPDANPPLPAPGQIYDLITNWVEKGVAPDRINLSSQASTPVSKSRPVCPYPKKASYTNGDVNVADSYNCS